MAHFIKIDRVGTVVDVVVVDDAILKGEDGSEVEQKELIFSLNYLVEHLNGIGNKHHTTQLKVS